jgi:NADH-quinone oxidoreductase subunit M
MLPGPSQEFAKYIYVLAITGATYTCAVAIRQKDLKRIIAYSSVSHMCSVVVALFSFRKAGLQAALYQGISHGFVSVALFILVGYIYDRFGTRNLEKYGGIGRVMPYYTVFLLFFSLSNLALPGLSSFVGEFGILFAVFSQSFVGGLVILVTVIVTGAYTLLLNNQVTFGNLQELTLVLLKDLNRREFYITLVLAFFVMVLGVYSDLIMPLFSDVASPTLGHIYY